MRFVLTIDSTDSVGKSTFSLLFLLYLLFLLVMSFCNGLLAMRLVNLTRWHQGVSPMVALTGSRRLFSCRFSNKVILFYLFALEVFITSLLGFSFTGTFTGTFTHLDIHSGCLPILLQSNATWCAAWTVPMCHTLSDCLFLP